MKTKLPPTNLVKRLRTFFGISQQDFARYLGISRSMLSMVETDERELPGTATLKYAELTVFAFGKAGLAEQPKGPAAPLTPEEKDSLLGQATDCEILAEKCRRQLAAMQKAYRQASHALALCEHLLPGVPAGKEGKKDRLILEIIQYDAQKTLQQNGPGGQAMLQWKLDGLVDGAKRARKMADEVVQ